MFVGGSEIHSSAELIRNVKIDGTVVLQALGYTSATLMAKQCSCTASIMNVQHTHTAYAHLHGHILRSVKINGNENYLCTNIHKYAHKIQEHRAGMQSSSLTR